MAPGGKPRGRRIEAMGKCSDEGRVRSEPGREMLFIRALIGYDPRGRLAHALYGALNLPRVCLAK